MKLNLQKGRTWPNSIRLQIKQLCDTYAGSEEQKGTLDSYALQAGRDYCTSLHSFGDKHCQMCINYFKKRLTQETDMFTRITLQLAIDKFSELKIK